MKNEEDELKLAKPLLTKRTILSRSRTLECSLISTLFEISVGHAIANFICVFADASRNVFGACAYIRWQIENNDPETVVYQR